MTDAPDLISKSGREGMKPGERASLLRADVSKPPFLGITSETRTTTQPIHDLKVTIGVARGAVALYEQARTRGETEETLAKGADHFFSDIECWILAWRRGGHREWVRVRREQWKRDQKGQP